ncbi:MULTISPECIES: sensor histidine kinase [unclassified Nocardiopsis]|uniref:sensor histidine kinase n=1 Tax=unclassified Nocardiopsis TaxID=2649073 RepID=UPI001914F8E0|nr:MULTISPECIES: histidine kinase [unclassified Nocardiopsis]
MRHPTPHPRLLLRPLTSAHTYRRWAYLVIGGALLTPYAVAALVLATLITDHTTAPPIPTHTLALLTALAAVAATAYLPGTRHAQTLLARALLQGPLTNTPHPTPTWRTTTRTSAWLCLHLTLGMASCLLTMTALTEAALLAATPLTPTTATIAQGPLTLTGHHPLTPTQRLLGPLLGLALLTALIYTLALTGHLLARTAPHLLGPSPTDLLAAAHARAHTLAERNRIARELHDSLGHALSVVTLQAATAARLLDTDPHFARQALTHIADQARTATADLDHALGVLREDTTTPRTPPPDLTHLPHLAQATHHTGTPLTCHITGDPARVPALLSRETYRITQEALTNALRHAPTAPPTLHLDITPGALTLTLTNPLTPAHRTHRPHPRGGHGITGMQERARLLGGTLTARPHHDTWHLTLHLTWKEHP